MLKSTPRPRAKPLPKPQREAESENAEGADDITDKICATLAGAVAERALKPGTKILEDAIADHFGVSRTVVRGALGILQRDHLLERKRNRGTFVAEPSVAEAKDLFETRRALERVILERVIQRATAADFDRLDVIVDDEQRVHDATDEAAKKGLSGQFHIELARLGGNEVMTELLGKVVARISLVMALYEEEPHDDCGTNHHREIIADLRRHDLAAAQERMDEHLADIESRVRLTQAQGDRHAFVSVLKAFSSP
ncbi:transcriptional regulator, GntR family [Kaistia soli DSM 19436]|uniref:Transcriptional regulator, GntR family n=1 Tax=Kaistia soli DSM 19436 TaxID=1122133 RepID=A0A1M5PFT7_9HYPH|nr:GntR family transcriptional regulator [Kaistia soli]SHH00605.1 transcriptional regulator, GntR family [Kaistia soli DSM 19436]